MVYLFIFLEYIAFIHVAIRWPSNSADYASATTYRIIEGNDFGYIDVCQWWFQPHSVSTIKEDKIELRRNMIPSEKQPWCQGMPPLLTSLAAFVTLSLWIYRLIHRMSIYREIKLLGFVIFIYKILISFYIFVTWIVELSQSNCIASFGCI